MKSVRASFRRTKRFRATREWKGARHVATHATPIQLFTKYLPTNKANTNNNSISIIPNTICEAIMSSNQHHSKGNKTRPGPGYACKHCGKAGGLSDSHWYQQCPRKAHGNRIVSTSKRQHGHGKGARGARSYTETRETVTYVNAHGKRQAPPAKPKTVACIFVQDESGSMGGAKERAAKAEIVRIVNDVLLPNHYVGVLGFANDVLVHQRPKMKKSLKGGIEAVVGKLSIRGATALYDAIAAAIAMVGFHAGTHCQIVVLTDGKNNRGSVSYDEIVEKVARPGMANGAKGFFHLTVIGVGRDVDHAKMEALCQPKHAQYLRVGDAGAKDLGAEVRRAFAAVERQLLRVVVTETRTVTVSGRGGGGGGGGLVGGFKALTLGATGGKGMLPKALGGHGHRKQAAGGRKRPKGPGDGYVCKLCGQAGGVAGAHWVQQCPLRAARGGGGGRAYS